MCDTLDCCPQCLPFVADATECIIGELLDFSFGSIGVVSTTCDDMECSQIAQAQDTTRQRWLNENNETESVPSEDDYTIVITGNATDVYEACRALTPGLFTGDQPRRQLIARSNYFDCLVEESLDLVEIVLDTESPTQAPATSGVSSVWMRGTVAMLVLLSTVWM